ncbi:MAG: M48 family metalloprotease [Pseudomonadota bacterium]
MRPTIVRVLIGLSTCFGLVCALLLAPLAHAGNGDKLYREYKRQNGIYEDPEWNAYVTSIGQRLLAAADIKKSFRFVIVDSPVVNASATGDGYVFVNRGLLAYMKSEEELAGVIGHEIGHDIARHISRRRAMRGVTNVASFVGAVLLGTGQIAGVGQAAGADLMAGFGRKHELEADEYGGRYLAMAGYNPMAMIDVIQVLKDHEMYQKQFEGAGGTYHGVFRSHPKNDKRLHEAVLANQHLFPDELEEPVGDFWDLMDGLKYGEADAAGVIKKNQYFHGVLRVAVTFPEDWDLINTGQEIMSRAAGGTTEASLKLTRQGGGKDAKTPEAYLRDTLKRTDVTAGEAREVNGYAAYMGEEPIIGTDAKLKLIAVISKDGDHYLLKGEAGPDGDADALREAFVATLESFRTMTKEDATEAKGNTISVIVAEPGMTYKSLAATSSVKRNAEDLLRVLNGDQPFGEPTAGDYVKVIQ